MYVRYTYVDSRTLQPVSLDQPYEGLVFPEGVTHIWSAESEFPTHTPNFYGTAEDADVPGILTVLTEDDFNRKYAEELQARHWKLVPKSVSSRRAKLALLAAGYYQNVDLYISSLTGNDGVAAQISWNNAQDFYREDPLVLSMGAALGWDDARLDELFQAAARIP